MPGPPPTAISAVRRRPMAASAGKRPTSSTCCARRCADRAGPFAMTEVGARRAGAFFGRRKGKKLRAGQADLVETLLPRLRLDPRQGLADPHGLFPREV